MDKEKAKDWTESQKTRATEIANEFLEGKIKSIPKD